MSVIFEASPQPGIVGQRVALAIRVPQEEPPVVLIGINVKLPSRSSRFLFGCGTPIDSGRSLVIPFPGDTPFGRWDLENGSTLGGVYKFQIQCQQNGKKVTKELDVTMSHPPSNFSEPDQTDNSNIQRRSTIQSLEDLGQEKLFLDNIKTIRDLLLGLRAEGDFDEVQVKAFERANRMLSSILLVRLDRIVHRIGTLQSEPKKEASVPMALDSEEYPNSGPLSNGAEQLHILGLSG